MAVRLIRWITTLGINARILVILGVAILLFIAKYSIGYLGDVVKEPVFMRTFNRVQSTPNEFCLVSYNILCDSSVLRHPNGYLPLSVKEKLKQPNPRRSLRHKQLMKELKWLKPDLITLQEVDEFYFPILVEELGRHDLEGYLIPHYAGSNGLVTFYNTKKFKLEKKVSYSFNEILGKLYDLSQFINSERIAQFTMLTSLETGKRLAVGNVHILFEKWKVPDMHALQVALFLQAFHKFASAGNGTVPSVISGDFNMYPFWPTYDMIANGKVSTEGLEKLNPYKYKYPQMIEKSVIEDKESFVLHNCRQHLFHPFKDIKSAYKSVLGSEPPLSHYQIDKEFPELYGFDIMKGTLDYIWYSSDTLQVNAVLEPVKEEVIKPLVACPNKYFPSDHLSIKACFGFKS